MVAASEIEAEREERWRHTHRERERLERDREMEEQIEEDETIQRIFFFKCLPPRCHVACHIGLVAYVARVGL